MGGRHEQTREEQSRDEGAGGGPPAQGAPQAEGTARRTQTSVEGRSAWARLVRMGKPRLTRAQLLGALLTVVLGFAIVTQVQQTQDSGLESMRQEDLVQVLDDVTQRSTRLDDQVRQLQTQRDQLKSGAGDSQSALTQAQERLDTLQILAGTVAATGPGIRMNISDPQGKVTSTILLDAVQELRDAGAEAIQVGPVRVVAQTWFGSQDGHLVVDGAPLTAPYTITAIGDRETMASAMNIPGGIVETVRSQGASASVDQVDSLTVDALQTPPTARYAQPVPQSPTSSPSK